MHGIQWVWRRLGWWLELSSSSLTIVVLVKSLMISWLSSLLVISANLWLRQFNAWGAAPKCNHMISVRHHACSWNPRGLGNCNEYATASVVGWFLPLYIFKHLNVCGAAPLCVNFRQNDALCQTNNQWGSGTSYEHWTPTALHSMLTCTKFPTNLTLSNTF